METYQTLPLGDETLRVRVRRSRRAEKIRIDVGLKGVTVVLPRRSSADPAEVLQRHAGWVRKQRARVARFDPDYAAKEAWLKANGTQLVFDPERWR